jgi:hypothetical protein
MMATGVTGLVLGGLVAGSVALQRSFAATIDYGTAQSDQMRISDYLAVDMRRALTVVPDGTGGVTLTLPNFYNGDGTVKSPVVVSTMGWPQKKRKKKKHKHQNIITSQTTSYDPTSTTTVKYYKGSATTLGTDPSKFYRESAGVARPIATDVSDFQVTLSDDGDLARTSITFTPRFKMHRIPGTDASTTFSQTILLRNHE